MVIKAEQVRPGDVVDYGGTQHVITEVRRPCGGAWAVACDGAGWAMALGTQLMAVRRRRVDHAPLAA